MTKDIMSKLSESFPTPNALEIGIAIAALQATSQ